MNNNLLRRPFALVLLVIAIPVIVIGRVSHDTAVAIAGYALLAIAIIVGLVVRR
ncbi:MAG TPA: hypothetical protein VF137_05715 [Candidatus Dormibacteraeota bacterium]